MPGDQQQQLRVQTRKRVRDRIGASTRTHVYQDLVMMVCEDVYAVHRDAYDLAAAEAINEAFTGVPRKAHYPEWRLSWNAWAL